MDLKNLRKTDPLTRHAVKQTEAEEYSPMNPPDAYAPPNAEAVSYEAMPAFVQKLMDDHDDIKTALVSFEKTLGQLQETGLTPDKTVDDGLKSFFSFFDDCMVEHHSREEKLLFPVLHDRLIEKGEHSAGPFPNTAIDMLEDDHARTMQLAAVTFNFLGLAVRLPDAASRAIVLDAAIEQGKALIEILRLHMFREDTIVFALAARYLSDDEFEKMERRSAGA